MEMMLLPGAALVLAVLVEWMLIRYESRGRRD